jgi:hypothetical protein
MTTEELTAKVLELEKAVAELRTRAFPPPPVLHLLWHMRDFGDEETFKLLGVFSSAEQAEEARKAVHDQPGFRDYPLGFVIDGYALDERHWTEGFVTVYRRDSR